MSIFDGHEDKSPEELANEFGISDLSVIDNASKQAIQTLDKSDESQKETYINYDIWTDNFSISTIKIGTKVIKTTTLNTGIITDIQNDEPKFRVKMDGVPNIIKVNENVFLDHFLVQKKEIPDSLPETKDIPTGLEIDTNIWTNNYTINHIRVGTKVIKTTTLNTGVITDIQNDEPKIKVKMDGVPNCILVNEEDFLKAYFIHKENKHGVFIGLSKKEIQSNNWNIFFDIESLGIGTRAMKHGNKLVGKIKWINIDDNLILLIMEDGSGESYSISDFQLNYLVYKKDLEDFTSLDENIKNNTTVWELIPKDINVLQRGARLLETNDKKIYHILDIESNNITIIDLKTDKIDYISPGSLRKTFLIYHKDIKIFQ